MESLPPSPHRLVGGFPITLSKIIMRLLSKQPDERYQSITGVHHDLKTCLTQVTQSGRIEPFTIGKRDEPARLILPEKLVGRERQMQTLREALTRSRDGNLELVLVSGPAGSGKTAFVRAFEEKVNGEEVVWLSAKCQPEWVNEPMALINAMCDCWVNRTLKQPGAALMHLRDALAAAMGDHLPLLLDLYPELAFLVEKQQPGAVLDPTQARTLMKIVLIKFIEFVENLHEQQAYFIDDLQWADALSMELITEKFKRATRKGALIIFAYREEAGHPSSRLTALLEATRASGVRDTAIKMETLPLADVCEMLAGALGCTPAQARPLAEFCMASSDGTPFSLHRCLQSLSDRGLFRFNPEMGRWEWPMNQLRRAMAESGAIDWAARSISTLPTGTMNLLKQAACIGGVFDISLLAAVSDQSNRRIIHAMRQPAEGGLIVRRQDYQPLASTEPDDIRAKERFEFVHDRIREMFYTCMAESHRRECHLSIARQLMGSPTASTESETLFSLANHLSLSGELIRHIKERIAAAEIYQAAGVSAMKKTAFSQAFDHFSKGVGLVGTEAWRTHFRLTLRLHLGLLESAYLIQRYDTFDEAAAEVKHYARSDSDLSKLYNIIALRHFSENNVVAGVDATLGALDALGIQLPPKPDDTDVMAELDALEKEFGERKISDTADLPKLTDPQLLQVSSLPVLMSNTALLYNQSLYNLLTIRQVRLALEKGWAPASINGLLLCGKLCALKSKEPMAARPYMLLGRRLAEKTMALQANRAIFSDLEIYHGQYTEPLGVIAERLLKPYQIHLDNGNRLWASMEITVACLMKYHSGAPLERIKPEILESKQTVDDLKYRGHMDTVWVLDQVIQYLMDPQKAYPLTADCLPQTRESVDCEGVSGTKAATVYYSLCRVTFFQRYFSYISGKYHDAILPSHADWIHEFEYLHWHEIVDLLFYDVLGRLALFPTLPRERQVYHRECIAEHRGVVQKLADSAPCLYGQKLLLITAEQARVAGDTATAMETYDRAIRKAEENEFNQDEALANELAAKFWLEKNKPGFAAIYFRAAKNAYTKWGAVRRVRELEETYPSFFPRQSPPDTKKTAPLSGAIDTVDFSAILRSAQALSKELSLSHLLEKLLETVIRNSGAVRGVLLLERDGRLTVSADGSVGADGFVFQRHEALSPPPQGQLFLGQAVMYAHRTGKMLVIKDARTDDRFAADPYVAGQKPRAVLCAPVMHQSICLGVIYLENHLAAGAFTPERVSVLGLLSAQIAISLANAQYVTEIKQETDARRAAEQRLAITLGSIGDGVIATDMDGRVTLINQAAEDLTGWTRDTATGKPLTEVFQIIEEETRRPCPDPVEKVLTTDRVVGLANHTVLIAKDGTERIIADSGAPIRDPSGQMVGVVLVFRDTTEKRQLESQLREAQKMEAIGTLSGGIAHDFNNILSAIIGCIDLTDQSLPPEAAERKWLTMAAKACDRAKALVGQILGFSRHHNEKPQPMLLAPLLKEIVKLLRASMPSYITITLETGENGLSVMADPTRLHQVIMNLCTNAFHAMGTDGGRIEIAMQQTTDFTPEMAGQLKPGAAPGGYARIMVRDTGCGMAAATLSRIFEPYFTTKEKGVGTGLGLAVAHGIINSFGGAITAESKPGKGSEFTVLLPLSPSVPDMEGAARKPAAGGSERILLVDDETVLLTVVGRALTNLGYTVVSCESPGDALTRFNHAPGGFDLVITDMTMPEMTGDRLTREIKKLRPDIPVIICTGFSDRLSPSVIETLDVRAVIPKPFDLVELGSTVRSVLDGVS